MPNFATLAAYVATITARFNKPKRSLTNEGLLKQDIIEALTDTAKYADDVKVAGEALNSSFIERSIKFSSIVYVDGTNGNDSRTGTTNDGNAATGRVKTLARVAELHSDKTTYLSIVLTGPGTVVMNSDVIIRCPFIVLSVYTGSKLFFSKKSISEGYGSYKLSLDSSTCDVYLASGAFIESEAHGGYVSGSMGTYNANNGCIRLVGGYLRSLGVSLYSAAHNTVIVGANTTIFTAGEGVDPGDRYPRCIFVQYGGYYIQNMGVNATLKTGFIGDRVILRSYTPTSSTDSLVNDDELVRDSNYLYSKHNGTIKKIAWSAF